MKIVCHNVDEVQVFGHRRDIIRQRGRRLGSGDGSTENKSVFIEFSSQFPKQTYVVLYVRWFATTLIGIFPIDVETIELVFLTEFNDVLDKSCANSRIGDDVGVFGGPLVPSTDGDERLSVRTLFSKLVEFAKTILAPIVGEIIPCVQYYDIALRIDTDKGIDQMGAKLRWNVRDVIFATRRSVDGPTTEITYDLLCGKRKVLSMNVVWRENPILFIFL